MSKKRKPVMHLLITDKCDRDCKWCCNKQYDVNDIPIATKEEYESVEIVCLTGGEPFEYSIPSDVATWLKSTYPNIKRVYVYTNAAPLSDCFLEIAAKKSNFDCLSNIDGLSVSIKNKHDLWSFEPIAKHKPVAKLKSNLLYVFDNLLPEYVGNFKVINREWQEDFKPAKNTIFRRLEGI